MATRSEERTTVAEYERMIAGGLLTEDDRVELLEGVITPMEPSGGAHIGCVNALTRILPGRMPADVQYQVQGPVAISFDDMPEPDVALLRLDPHDYRRRRPGPAEILLLIEVCDTSFKRDLEQKLPRYAAAGIVEVWLIDLPGQRLLCFREPKGLGYRRADSLVRGAALAPEACPHVQLTLGEILGPEAGD